MRLSSVRRSVIVAFVAVSLAVGPACAAAPAARPATTKVIRLPFPAYDGTLTPYTFGIGYPLVTLVYDTLLWRDAGGTPRPWLARSVTRSDDGLRLTVRLRDGVRWQDGRPLTAADVAFTLRFVAARYQPRFTPQISDIKRVRVPGRLTAVIDLRHPSLGVDDQPLADLPILPRHLWRGLPAGRDAPAGLPVGSGPYRLVSADKRRGYVFRANDRYFLGAPRVGEIRVPIIGDADKTYQALKDRKVDMVPLSLPASAADDLSSVLGLAVRRGPSYSGTSLVLNLRRAPFDRPAARLAAADALDLGRIVRNVAPAAAADEGFIHPASPASAGAGLHRFDPRVARAVLGRLGRAPLRVLAPGNDPVRLEAGRQVMLALRRVGAPATLVKLSRARLDRALGADGSPPDFTAAIQSTPPLASYDPDGLTRLFGSDPSTAPLNLSGYRSPAFDLIAARVASARDALTRRSATRVELELLARDAPAIPLFFSEAAFAYRPAIYDGWVFVKGTGILDKRSFLPGAAAGRRNPEANPGAATEVPGSGSGSGLGLLSIISLIVLAAVVALAAFALLQSRSRRER